MRFSKDYQPPEKWTEAQAIELADGLIAWMRKESKNGEPRNIFYKNYLYVEKGLYAGVTSYLSEKFPSVRLRFLTAKKIQEAKLTKYGAEGLLNPAMVKFLLSALHGLVETKKIEQTNIDVKPITTRRISAKVQ